MIGLNCKKILFYIISTLFVLWAYSFCSTSGKVIPDAKASDTKTVSLTGTVSAYINLTISTGSTIDFGNITPGAPKCGANLSGTVLSTITNAANGYGITIMDGVAGSNSAMRHTDTTTYIPDMNSGTIAAPVLWLTGTHLGVGISLYSAQTTKEPIWGTGTTMCDDFNKWAGIGQTAVTGHTVTGFRSVADTSSWAWRVDVANTQKTGVYSGNVTFTANEVLS